MKTKLHWPSTNFWQRTLFSIAFIALSASLIGVSYLPGWRWLFIIGLGAVQWVGLREFFRLCRAKGFDPADSFLPWFSLIYLLIHATAVLFPKFEYVPMAVLVLGALCTPLPFLSRQQGACANLSLTVMGFIYITLPLRWLIDINFAAHLPSGSTTSFWITWLLVTTKGSDMAAYFAGKLLGKHPLAVSLSPKKTVEGAVGGLAGAIVLSEILHRVWLYPAPSLPFLTWVSLGAAIGIAAMIGDLSESLLKRDAGVKDSNSIPGLGGVLDIIDSLLFSAPLLYVYLKVSGFLG